MYKKKKQKKQKKWNPKENTSHGFCLPALKLKVMKSEFDHVFIFLLIVSYFTEDGGSSLNLISVCFPLPGLACGSEQLSVVKYIYSSALLLGI